MIDDANKDELIEQYLSGEMSGSLLDEFKEKLAANEEFRKEVALQTALVRNIKAAGRKEWAMKLGNIHNGMNLSGSEDELPRVEKGNVKSINILYQKRYLVGIAAAVIVILFSVWFFTVNNSGTNPVFASYFKPYPSLMQTTRGLPREPAGERDAAFTAYRNGEYSASIKLFNSILGKQPDEEALFYSGNAYLCINEAGQAESAFKKYLATYKEFAVEAKWYLGLSYLKQGKINDAKALLTSLAHDGNDYSKKAEEVISQLH